MQLEVFEGNLGQVFEVGGQLARFAGSGLNEPTSLALMPKPEAITKRRYWLPGFGSPM